MKKTKDTTDFEAALAELEKIVEELEADVKLERALELFKRGIKLSTDCKKLLQTAQQEVLVLKELGRRFHRNRTYVANTITACLDQMHIARNIYVPDTELHFTFARSSGAGGQNVNKVNSKAILRWAISTNHSLPADVRQRFRHKYQQRISKTGDFILASQKYRDQTRNVDDCLNKLEHMLLTVAKAPTVRRPTKPTTASKKRRVEVKRVTSYKKQLRRRPSADD